MLPALTLRKCGEIQSVQSDLFLALQLGNLNDAKIALKALIADVPYSNKKLASMDMEERYRLIMSTIFNAIGFRVQVEKMLATAKKQIIDNHYLEPFKADKRKVIGLAVELDAEGKGLINWEEVKE